MPSFPRALRPGEIETGGNGELIHLEDVPGYAERHGVRPGLTGIAQIFAPASEHGTVGVHELQQQTVSLLSFKSMPKDIFDAQVSFNMLARYGEKSSRTKSPA